MAQVEDRWQAEPDRKGHGKRWRVRYRDPIGQHRNRSFDRQVDAERFAREVARDLDLGTFIDPTAGKITFGEYATRWLGNANDLRDTTAISYESAVRCHLAPAIGSISIARLQPDDFRNLIGELSAKGLSDGTVRKIVRLARTILATAANDRLVPHNPVEGVRLPKEEPRDMRILTADELDTLVNAIHPHYQALVLTAGVAGPRSGELRGLNPRNLNLLRGEMNIVEQLSEVRGELRLVQPKTKASSRKISLPGFLVKALEDQLANRATTDLVFTTPTGDPIRKSNFGRRIWQPAVTKVGLDSLRFHDLRHCAVAYAIAAGAHPKAIQERMGHSSITVTLDRYGHLFPSLDERLAEALDEGLRETLASHTRPRGATLSLA